MRLLLFCTFLFAFPALSRATVSDINTLLSNGNYAEARHSAEIAFAENPADPLAALLYAKTMQDGTKALDLYKKLAADSAFPDSVRAEANFRLGSAAYMKAKYHKAGQYFKKAGDHDTFAVRFLNAAHDTTDTATIALLTQQATDTSSDQGKTACYFLGLHFLGKKDFASSLQYFNMAAGTCDTMWWSCGSFAGACFCAQMLGRREESISVLRHMKRVFPSCIENNILTKVKAPQAAAKRDTAAKKALPVQSAKPSAARAVFCLQVGAFGSAENAGSLKVDLAKRYSPVSIMAAIVGEKTIYRVRVGAFGSREAAQAFGDSALTKKKLNFRIIEDVPAE